MSATGRMPTSPFEIESAKEIVQRRIENGDIQQKDLDLLKKGYRWMTTASFLGSVGMAIPTYLFLRRRQPPVGLGVKLLAGGGMGMLGSFLGFTIGGVAAAAEVNRQMENPNQKLKVFQEIAMEARKASIERSSAGRLPGDRGFNPNGEGNIPGRPSPSSSSTSSTAGSRPQRESIGVETSPSTWASESALDRSEMAAESARAGSFDSDLKDIRLDSGFGGRLPSVPASARRGGGGNARTPEAVGSERQGLEDGRRRGGEAGQTSWEQLRRGAGAGGVFPSAEQEGQRGMGVQGRGQQRENERMGSTGGIMGGATGSNANTGKGEGRGRTQEQREFDEMLERERKGVVSDDKWA